MEEAKEATGAGVETGTGAERDLHFTDDEILTDQCAVIVTLGGQKVRVEALPFKASTQWSKRVKRALFEQGHRDLAMVRAAAMTKPDPDDPEKTVQRPVADILADFERALAEGAGDDFEVIGDLLCEHDPQTAAAAAQARVPEIVAAFHKVYRLENPTKHLQAIFKDALKS